MRTTSGAVVLPAPPRLGPLYARALAGSRRRRPAALDGRAVVVPEVVVDGDRVARYAEVCSLGLTGDAPPTFPHLLAFGAQVHLMAAASFPLPLLGLVHLRQVVTQHRPLQVGERPSVRVWAERLAPHPRGASVDLRALLEVAGEPVWEGRSRYLSRAASAPAATAVTADGEQPLPELPEPTGPATALWPVGAGTGRRYAAVSGDVNPIHLTALSARALGFPRAIAHGMWTMARTTAALAPRLPGAVTLDVAFASPVLLPSTVALLVRPVEDEGGFDVALRSRGGERLHLSGTARAGARPV